MLTVSRDGTQIAFVAEKDATPPSRIYVRRLDNLDATAVTGTEGASAPFFSPDGSWIGFLAGDRLKKIPVTGGSAVDVAPAPSSRGAAWADDGSIVIALVRDDSLVRIPANGGTPVRVGALVEGEATQRWPQLLPGSGAVLFTGSRVPNAGYNEASLVVQPLPTGQRKTILTGGFHGRYLPSGHLVYVQNGTLFARAFDLNRLEATGPATPVIGGVMSDTNTGVAQFAVSDTGTLVYLAGESVTEGVDIQWLDRDGKTSPLRTTHANWWNLRFAPDRRRLALQITEGTDDIWIYEWSRDVLTRRDGERRRQHLPRMDSRRTPARIRLHAREQGAKPVLAARRRNRRRGAAHQQRQRPASRVMGSDWPVPRVRRTGCEIEIERDDAVD